MTYPAYVGHRHQGDGVHNRIFQRHLAYLNQEETPSKLKQRHVLENLILDFLSVVPHEEKFSFNEIATILEKSISENPNFSACKAALAFEALERYAINLLSHPWRKEYKVVKLFSGFYKHSIENQLLDANTIFLLLGYQQTDMEIMFLDDLVDPDKVAIVALDCLKAYAECQILLQICEKVKGYKCTWLEILNVRQEYTCGVDEAVRILQQLKKASFDQCKSEKWLNGREPNSTKDAFFCDRDKSQNHLQTDVLVDISSTWPSSTLPSVPLPRDVLVPQSSPYSSIHPTKSKNILYTHTKLPSWSEASYQIDPSKKLGRSEGSGDVLSRSFEEHLQLTLDHSKKGFTNSSCTPAVKSVTSPVFKSSGPKNYDCFENYDLQHRDPYNFVPNPKGVFGSPQMQFFPPGHILPPPFASYPCPIPPNMSCPHPGSLHYPLCCDPHLLPPPKPLSQKETPQHFQDKLNSLETQTLPNFLPDGSPPFSSASLQKRTPILRPEPFPVTSTLPSISNFNTITSQSSSSAQPSSKRESFYDNVPSHLEFETHQDPVNTPENTTAFRNQQVNGTNHFGLPAVPIKQKPKKMEIAANSAFQKPVQQTHHILNSHVSESSQAPEKTLDSKFTKTIHKKWACSSCTFYNSGERNICDMCGRSKEPGPEITPLVSGGRECPQCTLVNKKGSENCTACGASLKDSPTYI